MLWEWVTIQTEFDAYYCSVNSSSFSLGNHLLWLAWCWLPLACHLLPVFIRCYHCPHWFLPNGLIWSLSSNSSCSSGEALLCLFWLQAGGVLDQLLPSHTSWSLAYFPPPHSETIMSVAWNQPQSDIYTIEISKPYYRASSPGKLLVKHLQAHQCEPFILSEPSLCLIIWPKHSSETL